MLNSFLQTLALIQLYFRVFLHGKFACIVISYFCTRLSVQVNIILGIDRISVLGILQAPGTQVSGASTSRSSSDDDRPVWEQPSRKRKPKWLLETLKEAKDF